MSYNLTIAQLRYTKAQFAATNPVPLSGQLCIETDTNISKVGDGSTAYSALPVRPLSGEERTSADDVWAVFQTPQEKVWEGYISQSGTDAPMVVELTNTLGGVPVITYVYPGPYDLMVPDEDEYRAIGDIYDGVTFSKP